MAKASAFLSLHSCPCGGGQAYACCCEPLHEGVPAVTAEALMRSRYSAYVLGLESYIRQSWHASTCPADVMPDPQARWLGLQVMQHHQHDVAQAKVEFVARYKVNGRAFRLHEISRFVKEGKHWFYLDGHIVAS